MSLTWSRTSARDAIGSRHTFQALGSPSPNHMVDRIFVSTTSRKCLSRRSSRRSSASTQRASTSTSQRSQSKIACFDRTNMDREELWPRMANLSPEEYDPNQIMKKIGKECGPVRAGTAFVSPYFSRFRLDYQRPWTKDW